LTEDAGDLLRETSGLDRMERTERKNGRLDLCLVDHGEAPVVEGCGRKKKAPLLSALYPPYVSPSVTPPLSRVCGVSRFCKGSLYLESVNS
jgi:hypothetical protein